MASSTADADHITPSSCSNSSRKVRIVARIRGFTDQEAESLNEDSAPWISVQKPSEDVSSEKVKICFGNASTSHKDVYAVDYCYEQKEDNDLIFSREIKPLISSVFDGQNVSIIAYGARGSGKTYTIHGTEEKQGLAALAIAEVLSMAEDIDKSVAVSFYELIQEHVYDILDPTRPEVQVLEDANGKIKLKGLSQVVVKSVSEFHKLYFNECTSRRATQKVPFQLPRRSHKGLIIHILCNNQRSNTKLLGKMNFVDLAGYEDSRRKSFESLNLVESSQVNKSLYALLNVVYAINANKTHVSYRESKLTRMLQDSFGGTNHVLILTCLNPLFCQDTINTTSLASRSCQGVDRVFKNSMKISKISAKPRVLHSLNKGKLGTVSAAVKKPTSSRAYLSGKNSNCLGKGRKLFDEGNQLSSSKQEKSPSNIASILQSRFLSDISSAIVPCLQEEETSLLNAPTGTKPEEEKDFLLYSESNPSEVTLTVDKNIKASTYLEDGDITEKENKSLPISEDQSPPLSARLQELSNNLKSLYYSSPIQMKIPCETFTSSSELVVSADIVEPKTPVTGQDSRVKDNWEIANCHSETFSARSSGLKQSLVQEYLRFLNTASKEDLKGVRGIGEKRATYILELREESPEPFKDLDDLKDIGLSAKQIKGLMKNVAGGLF